MDIIYIIKYTDPESGRAYEHTAHSGTERDIIVADLQDDGFVLLGVETGRR